LFVHIQRNKVRQRNKGIGIAMVDKDELSSSDDRIKAFLVGKLADKHNQYERLPDGRFIVLPKPLEDGQTTQ
jgi:hypothetical protein